jgi:peptide/nickel transport system substrate-binding protein
MSPLTRRELLQRGAAAGVGLTIPGLLGTEDALASAFAASATPKRGGRLRVGFVGGGGTESVSANISFAQVDYARNMNLFDRLTPRASKYNSPPQGPGLASSLEPNKDGSSWTMKLRPDIEFHNGKSFGADDVIATLQRWLNKKVGVTDYGACKEIFDLKTTRKVNNLEVKIGMVRPYADLPTFLQGVGRSVTPTGITEKELRRHPIGTGPFKFVSFRAGQQSLFARNENYWVSGKPYLDELEIIDIDDSTSRLNALLSGQIDAMAYMDYVQAQRYRHSSKLKILSSKGANVVGFYVDTKQSPFDDVRVVTALKLAVDRKAMVKLIYRGFGFVANDVWGPGWPSYNTSLPQRTYNPEKAKALLKAAGHYPLNLTLITSTAVQGMLESAQAYVEQAKPAGINIKLKQKPAGNYFNSSVDYLHAPFYQTTWGGGAFETVFSYQSCGNVNETNWCISSWDKAFKKAQGTLNPRSRYAQLKKLEVPVWQKSGYIVWGYGDQLDAVSPKVMGFTPGFELPFGDANFKNYWFA